MPELTKHQLELLQSLHTNYYVGLSSSSSSSSYPHKEEDDYDYDNYNDETQPQNILTPPLNCPTWACIILPCIYKLPSMKLFQQIVPTEGEVLRQNNHSSSSSSSSNWIVYESCSISKGDIIRLTEGDIVPADCIVLSLGMNHYPQQQKKDSNTTTTNNINTKDSNNDTWNNRQEDLIVDLSNITGQTPITIRSIDLLPTTSQSSLLLEQEQEQPQTEPLLYPLYCGSFILQGCAIAVVTHIGSNTMIAHLMKQGLWPPTTASSSSMRQGLTSMKKLDGYSFIPHSYHYDDTTTITTTHGIV